jgi:hypothetical protein
VAGGIITAVEMLSFKLRGVENGTATDVDLRDSEFWKINEGCSNSNSRAKTEKQGAAGSGMDGNSTRAQNDTRQAQCTSSYQAKKKKKT